MKVQKRVAEFFGLQVIKFFAGAFYIAGLTALIPLFPLVFSPSQLVEAKYSLGTAFGLIFLGFLFLFWFSGSSKLACRVLGFMTLAPGLLGVFLLYSRVNLSKFLYVFGEWSPFVESYLEANVPRAWLLAGVYIIVGVVLVWVSARK
ncbi:hypothetical protein KY319_01275 [Candidatus Woesearchaeota archaeon]|nr:hypothetical protein [Candidatus Woesearchaeota archaeon]